MSVYAPAANDKESWKMTKDPDRNPDPLPKLDYYSSCYYCYHHLYMNLHLFLHCF